jgi:hypothetical protein
MTKPIHNRYFQSRPGGMYELLTLFYGDEMKKSVGLRTRKVATKIRDPDAIFNDRRMRLENLALKDGQKC